MCGIQSSIFSYACRFCNLEVKATRLYHKGVIASLPYEDYAAHQACSGCYRTINLVMGQFHQDYTGPGYVLFKGNHGEKHILKCTPPKIFGTITVAEVLGRKLVFGEFTVVLRNIPDALFDHLVLTVPVAQKLYSEETLSSKLYHYGSFESSQFKITKDGLVRALADSIEILKGKQDTQRNGIYAARVSDQIELLGKLKENVP